MAKYVDASGAEIISPDLSAGTIAPVEVIHRDAVPAVTHTESIDLPGGMALAWEVVDKPAQVAYTAMMTNTLLSESEG
jgi:hypothetical protein